MHYGSRGLALVGSLSVLLGVAACEPSQQEIQASRQEIRQTLESYLPKMAHAYSTGDLDPLKGLAAQRELGALDKNIRDFAHQGKVFQPKLKELTLENVNIWQGSNANVQTVEVWDVRVVAAGSDRLLGESKDQVSRVRYFLKKEDGRWRVMSRQRVESGPQAPAAPSAPSSSAPPAAPSSSPPAE